MTMTTMTLIRDDRNAQLFPGIGLAGYRKARLHEFGGSCSRGI